MVKLIIGVKGSGKTKSLIDQVNKAVESSKGSVVCVEKGIKLRYDVNCHCRLINVDEYFVYGAHKFFGFIAGLIASNHDISDLFIDSALKICENDIDKFESFLNNVDELTDKLGTNVVITASMPVEKATEGLKRFLPKD